MKTNRATKTYLTLVLTFALGLAGTIVHASFNEVTNPKREAAPSVQTSYLGMKLAGEFAKLQHRN